MSYENAPGTALVASHCAVCSRALLDAKSVEMGIGPECRRKYGFNLDVPEAARIEANRLVYLIAAQQDGPAVIPHINRLRELGFEKLADRIADRVAVIEIVVADGRIEVVTPYEEVVVESLRRIPGRRWEGLRKVNSFPESSRPALWSVIRRHYPGRTARGPKGLFLVPEVAA